MKKILAIVMTLALFVASACASDTYTNNPSALPAQAQQTLKKYFKSKVNHIKIDKKLTGTDYDVVLNDGTEIEFKGNGDLKEVESYNGVPAAILPQTVVKYVKAHYKGAKIVKLDIDRNKYDIELDNGIELEFDRAGNFLRMDR